MDGSPPPAAGGGRAILWGVVAVSVIVPLAEDDDAWRELSPRLPLPADWELLFAAIASPPADWQSSPQQRWIHCPRRGRGAQMNAAAEEASGALLWFVHADSRPPANFAAALLRSAAAAPRAVHYFDLRFYDGGARMRLNEWGARLRCALFGNPFGDQALAVRRDLFRELGGYPESSAPGEDHIFVLRAARAGARARRVRAAMGTRRADISSPRLAAHGCGISKNMVAAVAQLNGGLAVFVKTPELSPVKTRLAADIGAEAALRVYEMMLAAAAEMMRQTQDAGVSVYWAVGEKDGAAHSRWQEFPAIFTGEGDLGARLHRVYSFLLRRHGRAALAGADCPALTAATVLSALERAGDEVVVGPAADGGFYLFAAARRIPARVWTAVSYSRDDTLAQLLRHFPDGARRLQTLADVDDAASMRAAGIAPPQK